MPRKDNRSFYFQEIARVFFGLRGAPFVLSSRDAVAISSWEEKGIPLRVVLEGMERAFERHKMRAGGRKMSSLSFCEPEILKAGAEKTREKESGRRWRGFSALCLKKPVF
jgi:hypothetical protein